MVLSDITFSPGGVRRSRWVALRNAVASQDLESGM
jgi:hypothetical protein